MHKLPFILFWFRLYTNATIYTVSNLTVNVLSVLTGLVFLLYHLAHGGALYFAFEPADNI